MSDPAKIRNPVRLDDLIDVIKTGARRTARTTDRRHAGRRGAGRGRRPPHRPLRRPGPQIRRVVDRDRPVHGRHQAGRPEAVRAQGPHDAAALDPNAGFSRFTQRARRVIVEAQNKAHEAGNPEITACPPDPGPVRRPDGPRRTLVADQGVDVDRHRRAHHPAARVEKVPALIPFDARAKKALELTFRHALRLGHNYVGTEHMLLALYEEEDDGGTLHDVGIDWERFEGDLRRRAGSAHQELIANRPHNRAARRRLHDVKVRPFEEVVTRHGATVLRVCRAVSAP